MSEQFEYIELKIPSKPEYVSITRLTLSGVASRMGFSYDEIEDLKIATSEACTNAVQHAYKKKKEGEVLVGFRLYSNRIEVVVSDKGDSFHVQDVMKNLGPYDRGESFEFLREGGLGLYLIETLMDEVQIHHKDGVTVFMTKYLEGEQVERNAQSIST